MALAIVAVVLAVSGGFRATVGGFRISARSPLASTIAALIAGGAWFALARKQGSVAADLEAAWHAVERHASRIIGGVALAAAIVAAAFATRSAAGADASGYLSQAKEWSLGVPFHIDRSLPHESTLGGWLTTPLGWRPMRAADCRKCEGVQVPTYPPGLPLLMAIPHAIGGLAAANLVVIASAAIAVWATGLIAGGVAGIFAAVLIGFTPVFFYQSFQPMSDVPVTAAWMLSFLLLRDARPSSHWLAGIACAAAVLIRPNLAPFAIVPFVVARIKPAFAIPVVIAGAFLAFMHNSWYGSPLRSGYGTGEELFELANFGVNLVRYAGWLIATAPVLLLAVFGFFRVRADLSARALLIFALLVMDQYLFYAVFDHWSYLRFWLPALAVLAVFAAMELSAWITRWPASWRLPLFLMLVLGVTAHALFVARTRDTFKLAGQLRRVGEVAAFVNKQAPANAVIISGEQSGSARYYTDRLILRWEAATPEALRNAIDVLRRAGRPVYIVLDAFEDELFVKKFAAAPEVRIDWPPMVDAGTTHRTRLWRLADRDRFLAGEHINTVRLP